jgi:hypothetical protein
MLNPPRSGEEDIPSPSLVLRGKKFEFSSVEFDLQSANIKVRPAPSGNEGPVLATRTRTTRQGEVLAAPRALAEAPRLPRD